MTDSLERTIMLNSAANEDSVPGLMPMPDAKIYIAICKSAHDGDTVFYADNDGAALEYATHLFSKKPDVLEEILFSYRDALALETGMHVKVLAGNYRIITKGEDQSWGESIYTKDIPECVGFLLEYVDYPYHGWNVFLPIESLIVYVPSKMVEKIPL